MWVQGQGFPKSLDVSKAIDRMAGAEREVVGEHYRHGGGSAVSGSMSGPLGTASVLPLTAPATDDARRWQGWGTALRPAWEPIVVARKPLAGSVASNVITWGTGALNIDACRVGTDDTRSNANRQPARKWAGGEMSMTVPTGSESGRWPSNVVLSHSPWCEVCECGARGPHEPGDHCYDAQLDCAPGCPVAELDRQSGVSTSPPVGSVARTSGGQTIGTFAYEGRPPSPNGHGDSGGPSRFFPVFRYEAKAPTSERPRVGQKGAGEGRGYSSGLSDRVRQCRACGNRTIRSGETQPGCGHNDFEFVATAAREEHTAHPTVKPLDLMRWLVRLVTPPGGTVLDLFAGSGTTAEACVLEWFHCIAIERDETYLPLIRQRITKPLQPGLPGVTEDPAAPVRPVTRPKPARVEPAEPPAEQPDLFTLSE
jgi:hypothetical protein